MDYKQITSEVKTYNAGTNLFPGQGQKRSFLIAQLTQPRREQVVGPIFPVAFETDARNADEAEIPFLLMFVIVAYVGFGETTNLFGLVKVASNRFCPDLALLLPKVSFADYMDTARSALENGSPRVGFGRSGAIDLSEEHC